MEITGRVKVINEVQQVSASFKKRELVVTTDEQYPQHIIIEFTQEKTDMLSEYALGELIKVSINIRGREWVSPQGETKYFNSIQGWRIERMQVAAPAQPTYQTPPVTSSVTSPFEAAPSVIEEEHDDLPF
jgi:hypothetical protein